MEIELKAGPQGHFYFPKNLRENWGHKLKLSPDSTAGIIYPYNANLRDVKRSLEILLADFEHRLEIQERKKSK